MAIVIAAQHICPIWIASMEPTGKASIILSDGGYSLSIYKRKHNSFHDVSINNGTAGEGSCENHYRFDGKKYIFIFKKKSSPDDFC